MDGMDTLMHGMDGMDVWDTYRQCSYPSTIPVVFCLVNWGLHNLQHTMCVCRWVASILSTRRWTNTKVFNSFLRDVVAYRLGFTHPVKLFFPAWVRIMHIDCANKPNMYNVMVNNIIFCHDRSKPMYLMANPSLAAPERLFESSRSIPTRCGQFATPSCKRGW